jgi:hypothetical protein
LLWALALWDSYRPRATIVPGPSLNPKDPFATSFIIQNQGSLSIKKVSFNATWTYGDDPDQSRNVLYGITVIPELKSLEQHVLITPSEVEGRYVPMATAGPAGAGHHSFVLWFDVSYDPLFWPKRTTTIYFVGGWDIETNFQWFPTGSADIRTVATDAALIERAKQLMRQNEIEKAQFLKSQAQTNSSKTNSPPASTNGTVSVHTNKVNPGSP